MATYVTGITVKPPLTQRIKLNMLWWTTFIASLIVLYWQRGNFTIFLRDVLATTPLSFMTGWQLHEWFPTFVFPIIGFGVAKICSMAYKAKFKEVAPQEFTDLIYGLRDDVRAFHKDLKLFTAMFKPALTAKGVEFRVDKSGVHKISTEKQREAESDREVQQYEKGLEPGFQEYTEKMKDVEKGGEI